MATTIATSGNSQHDVRADELRARNGDISSIASSNWFASSCANNAVTKKATFPSTGIQPVPPATGIVDIRSSCASLLDLDSKTLEGLRQPYDSKFLPSLLLWDEIGQSLYGDILATRHYYPYRVENELLKQWIDEIARTVARSGPDMVVELGAGNMHKTTSLLASLDKYLDGPLIYYALDVDRIELERSLSALKERTNFRHIELRGLLGTYEDGARWLSGPETRLYRKTMVWLGNSVANLLPHEAGELLGSFVHLSEQGVQNLTGIVLAVDGCQNEDLIQTAYDLPDGQSRRWIKHALAAARSELGGLEAEKLFDYNNWRVEGRWDARHQHYENHLVAVRDLRATIRGQELRIEKGEQVHVLRSGKWAKSDVSRICSRHGLYVAEQWKNKEVDYSIYWLEPSPKHT